MGSGVFLALVDYVNFSKHLKEISTIETLCYKFLIL